MPNDLHDLLDRISLAPTAVRIHEDDCPHKWAHAYPGQPCLPGCETDAQFRDRLRAKLQGTD